MPVMLLSLINKDLRVLFVMVWLLGMKVDLCFMGVSMLLFFRVDKKRDKLERKVLDSQERAFWDVHRPVVCLTTAMITKPAWLLLLYGCNKLNMALKIDSGISLNIKSRREMQAGFDLIRHI